MKKLKSFGGKNLGGTGTSLPKNFSELQKLQAKMEEELKNLETLLANEEVQVEVGGALKIIATCDRQIKDIIYETDILEDQDMFKDLLKTAINEIWIKVDQIREEKTNEIIAKYNPLA
ncbi:MAG: YbaB/EbfC family nucleoid-associated protein [Fervidobacterium sp.]|nr:YbaB/EbfC family nucleoid-associated protein [Fervidobacterium sp.]